jgi:hypothetical protein
VGLSERLPNRRVLNLALAIVLVIGFIATFSSVMASCGTKAGSTRPLKDSEIQLLSRMRKNNFADGSVAIKGKIGKGARLTNVDGWVDWKRGLIYLSAANAGSGALVQARPGIIAIRPGELGKTTTGPPPEVPPADGWRVRPLDFSSEDKAPMDNLIAFLFLLAHDQADRTDLLKSLKNQWVRRDNANGTAVDVLLGPAVVPETQPSAAPAPSASPSASTKPLDPSSLEAHGGAVGYWLDPDAKLHRVETFLGDNLSTTIDFTRGKQPEFVPVDALGGRDISPREVTDAEATLISAMRQRDYRARGAAVVITLPVLPGALRQAKGWLDWQRGVAYLSVRDIDDPTYDVLMHATAKTVAIHKTGERLPEEPPLPAPKDKWDKAQWSDLSGTAEITDLDQLVYEALTMGANKVDDAQRIKAGARRLRVDVLNGVPVGVFELEQGAPAGLARTRYWLDNSGVLRRLELRTATGGLAQLDLDLAAKLPSLPTTVG